MNETPLLDRLRSDPDNAEWYEALAVAPRDDSLSWPDAASFDDFLALVEIPEEDRPGLRDLYPVVAGDPDLRWIVERYVGLLASRVGVIGYEALPPLPEEIGEIGRHLFTFVHAVHLPCSVAYQRERGVPWSITQATLADIGRHYVIERVAFGRSGLNGGERWLTLQARGLIYQLGRLQFERAHLGGSTSEGMRAQGIDCHKGDPVLSVHIPGFSGPFPPEVCDASFDLAREFFPRHFPKETYRFAVCKSWLLDRQLADYLPETSNIVQFQRRFQPAYAPEPDNHDTLDFVFRAPGRPLDELPQDTALQRAVVRHIRAGNSWAVTMGWLEL